MPLVQTRGAASAQGFGEFAQPAAPANYIEDVFSTYLYTGNGSTNNIDNQIDFTKGGLIWIKNRGSAQNHVLTDTVRGDDNYLSSNTTTANTSGGGIYLGTGFAAITSSALTNASNNTYCSWSFREQAKFFDVVTYTGNGGSGGRTISHNLGSAPGMIILKVTNLAGDDWYVYHRSIPNSVLALNSTNGTGSPPTPPQFAFGNGTTTVAPTSTNFTIGSTLNGNTYTYVAYLFAHDAGGFGAAGTDNVISCGSYTGNGSTTGPVIDLGYEPQWIMYKQTSSDGNNWFVVDNMRGLPVNGTTSYLIPNSTAAEGSGLGNILNITATGFQLKTTAASANANGDTYIYMAIRRGPMKTPTSGTSVFNTNLETTTANPQTLTTGFPVDLTINTLKSSAQPRYAADRLRGGTTTSSILLSPDSTAANHIICTSSTKATSVMGE